MGFNQKEYQKGRSVGLELADRLFYVFGIEALERDVNFRIETGISTDANTSAIDEGFANMKEFYFETTGCMALNILRDEFDFGKKRASIFIGKWLEEKKKYKAIGVVDWHENTKTIKEELKIDLLSDIKIPKVKTDSYDDGRIDGMKRYLQLRKEGNDAELGHLMVGRVKSVKVRADDSIGKQKMFQSVYKQHYKIKDVLEMICFEAVTTLAVKVLHDVYGFGETRLLRFIKRWELKNDCIEEEYCSWQDLVDVVEKELSIHLQYPRMIDEGWVMAS